MSDQLMPQKPQGGIPPVAGATPGGMPRAVPGGMPGVAPGDAMAGNVTKNLSIFDPKDFVILIKTMANDPRATVRDLLAKFGIDADGPVAQITQFLNKSMENATPLGQMKNIAAGARPNTALTPGGQPPVMPGRKPMVAPPRQPSPAGMEGLLNRLGGK